MREATGEGRCLLVEVDWVYWVLVGPGGGKSKVSSEVSGCGSVQPRLFGVSLLPLPSLNSLSL